MFRIRIIRNLTQKAIKQPNLLQNTKKLQYLFNFQQQSTVKSIQKVNNYDITSNLDHSKKFENNENNQIETEQEFLVKLKNNPDIFGDANEKEIIDEGDLQEEKYFEDQPAPTQKLSTKQYADIIKNLIAKRKIKEAIDIVEIRMLKQDRVKPENYIYNLLLGACGRVGYTKKAFSLYNQMKKRELEVTGGTYTALFNACANSPWPEDGLTRAQNLHKIMTEKMYEPNDTNYNAMIKAFGRCGDLQMAFKLVDEMIMKKFPIKDDTINFLLQACIADKSAGFRHALLVWRKLVNKKIKPTLFTYNLMLRSIRDCGIGDIEIMEDVINRILPGNALQISQNEHQNNTELLSRISENNLVNENIDDKTNLNSDLSKENQLIATDLDENHMDFYRPNLMAKIPRLGNLISLSEIKNAEDRLLLVGGYKEFLKNMEENRCKPDIKTFTQLLDNLPGNVAAEKELLHCMRKMDVYPDIDFFNMLIKKRSMRFDFENAKV